MRSMSLIVIGAAVSSAGAVIGWPSAHGAPAVAPPPGVAAAGTAPAPDRWESALAAFEARDREHPPAPGGIWLLGSSNIRLWKTLDTDFPGMPLEGRGVGGCRLAELAEFAPRLVAAGSPRVIVVSAGTNDVNAGADAAEVRDAFARLVANVRETRPDAVIAFLAIAPSIKRWEQIDRQRAANEAVRAFIEAADDDRLRYLDASADFLGPDGKPDPACFVADLLHPSVEGNARRAAILRPVFAELLDAAPQVTPAAVAP